MTDFDGLHQTLAEMRSGLGGQLKIGAIPVTLPIVSLLTTPFAKVHSRTTMVIRSLTSIEIQRGLDDFTLDIGVTYLDNEPLVRVRRLKLYIERYVLLAWDSDQLKNRETISWSEAAAYPLCLLTSDMQNRRILDMHFREAGAEAHAVIETNSLITLWSHLYFGRGKAVRFEPRDCPTAWLDRRFCRAST
jgi:DNA-binding transcriptional LysR family regulator